MTATWFDTAKSMDDLEAVKIPREQARAIVEVIRTVQEAVSAEQIKTTQEASTRAVEELDSKTEKALIKLEGKMDTRLAEIRGELTLLKWMFGAMVAGIATLLVRTFTA